MGPKHQKRCRFFFLITLCLEGGGVALIVLQIMSFCVLGGEISSMVMFYLLLVPVTLVCDAAFLVLMLKMNTLGVDPVAVMYNAVVGITCILGGIAGILVVLNFCGNISQLFIIAAGGLAVAAGIIHLMNFFYCNKKMSPCEKRWPPSRAHSREPNSALAGIMKKTKEPIPKKAAKPMRATKSKSKKVAPAKAAAAPRAATTKASKGQKKTPWWKCAACRRKKRDEKAKVTPPASPGPAKKRKLWCLCRKQKDPYKDKNKAKAATPPPSPGPSKKGKAIKTKKPWCRCSCGRKKDPCKDKRKAATPPPSPGPSKKMKKGKKADSKSGEPWWQCHALDNILKKDPCKDKGKGKAATPPPSPGPSQKGKAMKTKKSWCRCPCRRKKDPCKDKRKATTPPPSPGPSKKTKKGKKADNISGEPWWQCHALDNILKKDPCKDKGKGKAATPPPSPGPSKKGKVMKTKKSWCRCPCRRKKDPCKDKRKAATPPPSPGPSKKMKKGKKADSKSGEPWWQCHALDNIMKKDPCKDTGKAKAATPPPSPGPSKKGKVQKKKKSWCRCPCRRKKDPCKDKRKAATPPPSPGPSKKMKQGKKADSKSGEPWWQCHALDNLLKKDPCKDKGKGKAATPSPSPGPSKKGKAIKTKKPWCRCSCGRKKDPCKDKRKAVTPPPSPGPSKKAKKGKKADSISGEPWWQCHALDNILKKDPCKDKGKAKAATPPPSPGPSKKAKKGKKADSKIGEPWWQCHELGKILKKDPSDPSKGKGKGRGKAKAATPTTSPKPTKKRSKKADAKTGDPWWQCHALDSILKREPADVCEREWKRGRSATRSYSPGPSKGKARNRSR